MDGDVEDLSLMLEIFLILDFLDFARSAKVQFNLVQPFVMSSMDVKLLPLHHSIGLFLVDSGSDYRALVGGLYGLIILLSKPIFIDTFEHCFDNISKLPLEGEVSYHEEVKLLPQNARPFLVLKRINDNAYVLYMPQEFGGIDDPNLRTNSFQEGESYMSWGDQEGTQRDLARTIGESLQGPLTKGRLKKLEAKVQRNKDLLRGQGASKVGSTLFGLSSAFGRTLRLWTLRLDKRLNVTYEASWRFCEAFGRRCPLDDPLARPSLIVEEEEDDDDDDDDAPFITRLTKKKEK
ncbi:hypothetical protein CR513_04149, partial [Mucuna pruriens]